MNQGKGKDYNHGSQVNDYRMMTKEQMTNGNESTKHISGFEERSNEQNGIPSWLC